MYLNSLNLLSVKSFIKTFFPPSLPPFLPFMPQTFFTTWDTNKNRAAAFKGPQSNASNLTAIQQHRLGIIIEGSLYVQVTQQREI